MGYSVYYNGELSVTPTLTEADEDIFRAVVNGEHTVETLAVLALIAASPEPDLPWHVGLLKFQRRGTSFFQKRMRAVLV